MEGHFDDRAGCELPDIADDSKEEEEVTILNCRDVQFITEFILIKIDNVKKIPRLWRY